MHDGPIDHPVLLERICRQFDLGLLVRVHETHVLIAYEDFRLQWLIVRHQTHQDATWLDHGAHSMGGEILNDAGLRRPQLEESGLVLHLGVFLPKLVNLRLGLDTFILQLAAVVRGDLRDLPFGGGDGRFEACDRRHLCLQFLLFFDALARLVVRRERAHKTFLR